MNKKRMALILPGLGYHSDKPLLYYAKKLFSKRGYEIKEITYRSLPEWTKDNLDVMGKIVTDQAKKAFDQMDVQSYEEIVFISKSIGSIAACRLIHEWKKDWKHICFTPVEVTIPLLESGETIIFSGTSDPFVDCSKLKQACNEKGIPLYQMDGGNHSLETGDIIRDIKELGKIMKKLQQSV